jgi:hypothetical protein
VGEDLDFGVAGPDRWQQPTRPALASSNIASGDQPFGPGTYAMLPAVPAVAGEEHGRIALSSDTSGPLYDNATALQGEEAQLQWAIALSLSSSACPPPQK